MKQRLVLFFTLFNSIFIFSQNGIEGIWVNQDLFQIEIKSTASGLQVFSNQNIKGEIFGLNLILNDTISNAKYQFTINQITNDSILISPQTENTNLVWGIQKFYKKSFLENQIRDFEKLTMIYHNSCPSCAGNIIEVNKNGIFKIRFESAGTGLIKVMEGKLHPLDLKIFMELIQKSLIHKYPRFDLSNRFVSTDIDLYYFSIHINGEILQSGFQGDPPNGRALTYFLLNIGELAKLKTIDENYPFEIR